MIQLDGKKCLNSKRNKLMVINFVLPGRSMRKPIGGFRVVYEYVSCLAAGGHPVNATHPLILFSEGTDLKDKRKTFSPSTESPILGILEFKLFDISLRE